jgi:hypothetical protein
VCCLEVGRWALGVNVGILGGDGAKNTELKVVADPDDVWKADGRC